MVVACSARGADSLTDIYKGDAGQLGVLADSHRLVETRT